MSTSIKCIFFIILIVFTAVVLTPPLLRINFQVSLLSNEGWNAYHTADAINSLPLYQRNYTVLNYPPISFYFIGIISKLTGDILLAGRYVSLVSFLLINFFIYLIIRYFKGGFFEIIASICLNIIFFTSIQNNYIFTFDPQIFAQSIQLFGLFVYLKWSDKKYIQIFLVPFILTISLFTKQNLLALPLAIIIDSFLNNRKIWVKCSLSFLVMLIIFASATQFLSGENFIYSMIQQRLYSLSAAINQIIFFISRFPFLIIGFLGCFLTFKKYKVLAFYFLFSILVGFIFSGGDGVTLNIYFDTIISTSLIFGLLLIYLKQNIPHKNLLYIFIFLILTFNLILFIPIQQHIFANIYQNFSKQQIYRKDYIFIKNQPGLAICQDYLLCYLSGKPFSYDPFSMRQMLILGKIDEKSVLEKLKTHQFSVIQLGKPVFQTTWGITVQPPVSQIVRYKASPKIFYAL